MPDNAGFEPARNPQVESLRKVRDRSCAELDAQFRLLREESFRTLALVSALRSTQPYHY